MALGCPGLSMGLYPHHWPQPPVPPTGLPEKQVTGPGRWGLLLSSLNYLDLFSSHPEEESQALLTPPAATALGEVVLPDCTRMPLRRCSWAAPTRGGEGSVV